MQRLTEKRGRAAEEEQFQIILGIFEADQNLKGLFETISEYPQALFERGQNLEGQLETLYALPGFVRSYK